MRINKAILLLIAFARAFAGSAQDGALPSYPILSDTAYEQFISPVYWEKLEDMAGNFTIDEVRGPELAAKFHKPGTRSFFADTIAKTHWMRFRLNNASGRTVKVSIGSGSELTDHYVVRANNDIAHFPTGWKYPWRKKEGLKKINAAPVVLQPGEEAWVFMRKQNKALFHIPSGYKIPLYSTEQFIQKEFYDYQDNALDISYVYLSFFSGMLLLAAIFNFLIYRSVKSKVNLYFSLFLLGMFTWYSPVFRILLQRESALFSDIFGVLGGFWMVFLLFFIRHYFRLFNKYPRWDKGLVLFSVVMIIISFGRTFSPPTNSLINNILVFIVTAYLVSVFATMFLSVFEKGVHKKIFYIAVSPLMIFLIGSFAFSLSFKQMFTQKWININDYIGGVCIMWAVVVFSKYLFEDYGRQQQQILQVQIEKEREQASFIAQQKLELEKQVRERTEDLKQSIDDLKAAQSQLVHSEKMASLGELTAGIAHEIQNPLNFINNFSQVNIELIDELYEELGNLHIEEVKSIANDLKVNNEKITFHGNRADSIVKNMLLHSRKNSGQKEFININALAEEYFRLSYHGLRAKDKSFNVTMETNLDESIGEIRIVSQDISRVLLNLFNNAFYSVHEKMKNNLNGYKPLVTLTTKQTGSAVAIEVKDNGMGIPQKLIEKIYQPFFTTKPTGEGTGLGLSMSYDIIKKGHGGELNVISKEGEFASFTITLPV